ncbi:MAG: cupin domain-containing protein, partial [Opitutaceae bacterium]|nr:cupin domain-containing protein [Opitutaceae bacterium]
MKHGGLSRLAEEAVSHNARVRKRVLLRRGEVAGVTQVSLAVFPPNEGAPAHAHADMRELFVCKTGAGVAVVEGREIALAPGEFLLVDAGESHEIRNTGAEPLEVWCMGFADGKPDGGLSSLSTEPLAAPPPEGAGIPAVRKPGPTRRIVGVDFFAGSLDALVENAMKGGLVVVPAAPALATDFMRSAEYREALLSADIATTDSGFMVLLWWLRTGKWLRKHSGLAFLRALLRNADFRAARIFWIMPTEAERERTKTWLADNGIAAEDADFYTAPFYGKKGAVEDETLAARIAARRPAAVVVGLGGGTQERLGLFLRRRLDFTPGIFCIGAAIAFLT